MAFVLKEEHVEQLVQQVNVDNPAFQFDWKSYIYAMQQSGRTVRNFILVENQDYIAAIGIAMFDVTSINSLDIIAKVRFKAINSSQVQWLIK